MSSQPPSQYKVFNTIDDPYDVFDNSEYCGTFSTLSAANEAARTALLKEYSRDAFDEWEERIDDNGFVQLSATFSDRESAKVWVTEVSEE